MNTALKADFLKKNSEKRIKNLSYQISKCSPVPNAPDAKGPAFVKLDSAFKTAADYEGMMGSLIMESFLGSAFSDAANDGASMSALSAIDSQATDLFMEYMEERGSADNNRGKGRGSIALYEREKENGLDCFNEVANDDWPEDLDQRLDLEEALAREQEQYYAWDYQAQLGRKILASPSM